MSNKVLWLFTLNGNQIKSYLLFDNCPHYSTKKRVPQKYPHSILEKKFLPDIALKLYLWDI
jgi:hypothetical protein